jgi:hypothetical protein
MQTKNGTELTKTTIKVWAPLADKLEARMNELCLRRDQFLTRLLALEVEHLDQEVAVPNSEAVHNHLLWAFKQLNSKGVSLALPPDLVERINAVCKHKRIVRDAFFNRLFLLLSTSASGLSTLLFPIWEGDWKKDVWQAFKDDPTSVAMGVLPLHAINDPFWAVREAFRLEQEELTLNHTADAASGQAALMHEVEPGLFALPPNLYTRYWTQEIGGHSLMGLNCYLPDWMLPANAVRREHNNLLDLL